MSSHAENLNCCRFRDGKLYISGAKAAVQGSAQKLTATTSAADWSISPAANIVYAVVADSAGNVATGSEDATVVSGTAHKTLRVYDSTGVLYWESDIGSSVGYGGVRGACYDSSDNLYVAGSGAPLGFEAGLIRKYTQSGTAVWTYFGTFNGSDNRFYGVATDSTTITGVGAVGEDASSGGSLKNVHQLDMRGTVSWKKYTDQNLFGVAYLSDGSVVVCGDRGNSSVSPITVYDTSGTVVWTKNYSGSIARAVAVDSNDNIYIGGGGNAAFATHLEKRDVDGNLLATFNWKFGRPTTLAGTPSITSLAVDGDDNLYVAGDFWQ